MRFAVRLLVASCIGLGACSGPRIYQFDAKPRVLCGKNAPAFAWNTDGEASLDIEAEPSPPQDPSCARTGIDLYEMTLLVRKSSDTVTRRMEVAHVAGRATEPVAIETQQVVGSEVVASSDKNAGIWNPAVEVVTVVACGGRELHVEHAGRTATLSTGAPSSAFEGTPLGGLWELRSPLTTDEQTTPSSRPRQLALVATIRCKGETSR